MPRLDLQWKCWTLEMSEELPSAIVHITHLRNPYNLEGRNINQTLDHHP